MNWDMIEGKWREVRGQVRQRWGKLTDDDLEQIRGRRDELAGRLQKTYGYSKDDANREIDDFANSLKLR